MAKEEGTIIEKKKHLFKLTDTAKSIGMLLITTAIGLLFRKLGMSETNIILVYILGVSFTSVLTDHQAYSMTFAVVSTFMFNFLFTEPRYTLWAYDKDYPMTFLTMLVVATLTSSLSRKLKLQAEKAAMVEMEAQKEQLRADLLRTISHDLRTPLTSISGNASNLLSNEDQFDEETKKRLYTDIYDDSMWLIRMVENLLAVTRIEDGRLNIHLQAELVEDIIQEALKHISREKTEHTITVHAMDDLLLVKADARLIVQVIINLVDNAIKYTPKGSHIDISSRKERDQVLISIADDGPGIPDDKKTLVFTMFYTDATDIADSKRSLGLGLSLCTSIIEAHGGALTVTDNVPKGAVFTFSLPAEEVHLSEKDFIV